MDLIKDAFTRAKEDIISIKTQMDSLYSEILELKSLLSDITQHIHSKSPTIQQINETKDASLNPTHINNLDFWAYKALKPHKYTLSTGNEGVPTDSQTNQQTVTLSNNPPISNGERDISSILNSLDTYKKELRNKFKRLTKQEMLVFVTLYQLEEEGFIVDYSLLSKKLSLSESSIRDYIQRILKKNILLIKSKENNKKIYLKIPDEMKKLASLNTIIQLREI